MNKPDVDKHLLDEESVKIISLFPTFLLGCISFLRFQAIGTLFIVELLLGLLLMHHIMNRSAGQNLALKDIRIFTTLAALWLTAIIVSDTIQRIPATDMAKGWATPIVTATNMLGLALLLKFNRQRILAFGFGLASSGVAAFFLQPGDYARAYPWKFGFAFPVLLVLACSLQASNRRSQRLAAAALACYGLSSLVLGGRSMAGVAMLAALLVVWPKNVETRVFSILHLICLAALIVVLGISLVKAYSFAAVNGYLGPTAQQKFIDQASRDSNVVLAGRPEVVYGISAIIESPLLGHGSFAPRTYKTDVEAEQMFEKLHMNVNWDQTQGWNGEIPSHSFLVEAWVRAGVLGAIIWLWFFCFLIRSIIYAVRDNGPLSILVIVLGALTCWDVLFSPYGADRLFMVPFVFIVCLANRPHKGSEEMKVSLLAQAGLPRRSGAIVGATNR